MLIYSEGNNTFQILLLLSRNSDQENNKWNTALWLLQLLRIPVVMTLKNHEWKLALAKRDVSSSQQAFISVRNSLSFIGGEHSTSLCAVRTNFPTVAVPNGPQAWLLSQPWLLYSSSLGHFLLLSSIFFICLAFCIHSFIPLILLIH